MHVAPFDLDAARRVTDLVYQVFGFTFSILDYYEPERLHAQHAAGERRCVLVEDGRRRPLGYFDYRFAWGGDRRAGEFGLLLTNPDLDTVARSQTINLARRALLDLIRSDVTDHGLAVFRTTDSTDHALTQRLSSALRMRCTGLLLGTIPHGGHQLRRAAADMTAGRTAGRRGVPAGRRAETMSIHVVRRRLRPYAVTVPARYAGLCAMIYDRLGLPATTAPALRAAGPTRLTCGVSVARGIATILVADVGADAPERVGTAARYYADGLVPTIHVFVPLTSADCEPLLAALCEDGFRFAGLLPRYLGHDMLIMQHTTHIDRTLRAEDLDDATARAIHAELFEDAEDRAGSRV